MFINQIITLFELLTIFNGKNCYPQIFFLYFFFEIFWKRIQKSYKFLRFFTNHG